MNNKQSRYLVPFSLAIGIALFSSVALEISRTFLRPTYGKGTGFIPELLGVLPNFLAGFGMPFLALGAYYGVLVELERTNTRQLLSIQNKNKQLVIAFLVVTVLNTVGLTLWEYSQLNGNLTFDQKDITATIIGSVVCVYCFTKISTAKA